MEEKDDWDIGQGRDEREERRRERLVKLSSVVRDLAKTNDGKFFLRWIMAECGVFEQTFPRDEKLSIWNAGRRSFGLQVLEVCAAARCAAMLLETKE